MWRQTRCARSGGMLRLIAALVVIALASASLLVSQLPRRYSAEALVHPDLFRGEEGGKTMPLASIDGAALVSSEAQLIRSPLMVRTVIKRFGLDRDPEFVAPSSEWLQGLNWVRAALLPETVVSAPLERAAAHVAQRLKVINDTRSYLISVSFTAASPEKAAKVANAFALEYVRGQDGATHRGRGDSSQPRVGAAVRDLWREASQHFASQDRAGGRALASASCCQRARERCRQDCSR